MSSEDRKKALPHTAEPKQHKDDFWSIERLLPDPPSKPLYAPVTPPRTPQAIDIEVPSPKRSATPAIRTITVPPAGEMPLSFKGYRGGDEENNAPKEAAGARSSEKTVASPEPLLSYEPEGLLLHKVRVYDGPSNYHYFDQFMKDALAYASMSGQPCEAVSFFSYFPQYAQLNRRQRAWYLYFRQQVREGNYPETDYAYILLYLFELINLPAEGERAESHRDLMAKVWVAYRKTYPQLDHYACEWLCDYCLIHGLPAPILHLLPTLDYIVETARLKEFYLSSMIAVGHERINLASARILLSHCCQYDYRRSKFYTQEHQKLFDETIPRAMAAIFPVLITNPASGHPQGDVGGHMQDSLVSRDAYVGALCAYGNKRRIEVSYVSFSRSHDLRFTVGDMVRHIENRIRASLLIRSRLTIHFLTVPLRKELDDWLDHHLPSVESAKKKAELDLPPPAYEALYDLPRGTVSITSADEIERSSWETTKILVEAFGEDEDGAFTTDIPPMETADVQLADKAPTSLTHPRTSLPAPTEERPLLVALGENLAFLRAVVRRDKTAQKEFCAAVKKLPDAVADEINDAAVAHEIFDVILCEDGMGGFEIIDDYRETVAEILSV